MPTLLGGFHHQAIGIDDCIIDRAMSITQTDIVKSNLRDRAHATLRNQFGLSEFRLGQFEVIDDL
jgi:hypothetical protein